MCIVKCIDIMVLSKVERMLFVHDFVVDLVRKCRGITIGTKWFQKDVLYYKLTKTMSHRNMSEILVDRCRLGHGRAKLKSI
jgi:hypothetical protein